MLDQQEKYNIPLHLILIFVLLVIGIVTSGYVLYAIQKAEFKKRENNNLSVVADLKVREIVNWRKERLEDARAVQQNLPAIHRIRQYLNNPSSGGSRQELLSWIKSLRESGQYGSVVLLDTNKQIRLYSGDETRLVGSNALSLADEAMRTKQIVFSDIRWGQLKHVLRIDIFVPLIIREGHKNIPVGVFLLRIDPHHTLYPIVQFWPTASLTAETLVIRREGDEVVFLNELRHKKDTALTFRMPISEKQLPAAMAARREEGIVEGMDYRGVPVLAAIKAVRGTSWYIIAKIDSDEVYAPIQERFWMMVIAVCALIILAGTATALAWRHQRAQFYRKQYEAELERKAVTNHYEYLTKYANDIILMMDADWKIVEANDRAVQAYGCTRDELLQMNIRDIRDPGALPKLEGLLEQLDERNGMVYETIHHRKDGTTFPAEISARTITVEGKKFYQGIIRDITERKRAEEALQISESRYRRLFESARDGILILDADTGQVIDANQFMQDLLGYSCEEFVGKRLWDIGPFKDIAASKDSFDELKRKGYIHYEDLPVETRDGRRINVEFISYTYMVDSKNVIQCNIRDITERKRAEEALRETQDLLNEVGEIAKIGGWKMDIINRKATWTQGTHDIVEIAPGAPIPGPDEHVDYYLPEYRPLVVEAMRALIEDDKPLDFEAQLRTAKGNVKWCRAMGRIIREGGKAVEVYGTFQDITDRRRAEEALRDSEGRLHTLVQSIPDIIWLKDKDGVYLSCNAMFERFFGAREADIVGRTDYDFVDRELADVFREHDRKAMAEGKPTSKEDWITFADDGHRALMDTIKTPMHDAQGKLIGVLGIGRDITDRKRAEEERETAAEFLHLVNESGNKMQMIRAAVTFFKQKCECEAVGVRLQEGDDYPYYEYRGFSDEFIQLEKYLCDHDSEGRVIRDSAGNPVLECMCGNVICGRFDPSKPFFTSAGSFWSNCTTKLLASTTEADRQARTRNRCNGEGYESVALIPLGSGDERFGLLQLNDRRQGRFTPEKIALWERLAGYLAVALGKFEAEESLRKSEEYFRAITENASDIILIVDRKGTITYASPSVDPILGLKPEELIGKSSLDLIVPDDLQRAVHDFSKAILTEGTLVPNAFRVRHKDGSEHVLEGVGKNLFRNPAVSGFVMNVRDVTERRQAEEEVRKYSAELTEKNEELRAMTQQLWQAAKLATMGELAASIAHELNNPLATVSMRAESLLIKTQQDSPMWRELKIIEQEVERMATLIANLLQFSRRGQKQISTVDICEEIEKALELIYYHLRKKNIVTRREFPKEALRIHADREQLRQLFLNLFTNAGDAMPRGGTLTLRVTTPPESGQVIIEVADTGTGIPPEILPKVAEPFYTTKPEGKGTGLGLAICRRIVQEHNGIFDLTSEGIPGKGTTARISLSVKNGINSAGLKNQ